MRIPPCPRTIGGPTLDLATALQDRYRLGHELGRGGMATVFLARDLRHGREVALKIIRPELAAVIGPERFLREIETTARLAHPAILSLLDSGDAGGMLWYAMPYLDGGTLKDRLARQGPMPLAEALTVFGDVAGALAYAHRQGVIHRDIKPANILLQDGRAVLADFGIALPTDATHVRLTESGLSVGTPEYMSPEQALGERSLDNRSDIYALGCVLYQMLAGEPPFTGLTPQAVIAKRLMDPVPRLGTVRDVPAPVEAAITRALGRQPADRFQTVEEFAQAVASTTPLRIPESTARGTGRRWVALLVIVAAGVIALRASRGTPASYDAGLVAVMPARVSSPGHALDYLGEGFLDLAAARLTGEGGPRAADPRATLAALRTLGRDDPAQLARRLGAGRILDESIIADGTRLTITATLTSFPGGRRQAPVTVEGSQDSLGALTDRLMIQLLALHAGEHSTALTQVASLPAWRAYLEARSAYRSGQYDNAIKGYEQALAIDSTFVLAGLAEISALARAGRDVGGRMRQVYRDRHRLSGADSLWFVAVAGPDYPRPTRARDQVTANETAAERLADRADAWFELGDVQLHAGASLDLDNWMGLAERSFNRAVALDSSFALPIEHLLFLAYARKDTAAVRRLMTLYLAHDSLGTRGGFYLWRSAVALGDSAGVARERTGFPALSDQSLQWIVASPQEDGIGVGDAVLADSVLRARAATESEREAAQLFHGILMLNLGRPTAPPIPGPVAVIDNAVFADGDPVPALEVVRQLRARLTSPHPPAWYELWELACWDLMHGDASSARKFSAEFTAHVPADLPESEQRDDVVLAPGLLALWSDSLPHAAKARLLLAGLDSLASTGPSTYYGEATALLLGRFFSAAGSPERALRALRRVSHFVWRPYNIVPLRLARARAAAAAGQREEAIESYRVYLALRSNPAPRLIPQRDSARAELAALTPPRTP